MRYQIEKIGQQTVPSLVDSRSNCQCLGPTRSVLLLSESGNRIYRKHTGLFRNDLSGKSDPFGNTHFDDGGLGFFIRWLHRPQLRFHEISTPTITVIFRTHNVPVRKRIKLVLISVWNNGKDKAVNPIIDIILVPLTPRPTQVLVPLNKRVTLLDAIEESSMGSPDDRTLAIAFLKKGLETIPYLEGDKISTRFLCGFTIEDSDQFVFATDKAMDLITIPVNNERKVGATIMADRVGREVLFSDGRLKLGFAWDQLELNVGGS